jgi:hypothetical protein
VEGQSFIFRAEAAGTYILKFYKQDFVQDYIINDHVQVIIGEVFENTGIIQPGFPVERDRVIAEPRWPPVAGSAAATPSARIQPSVSPAAPPAGTTTDSQAETGSGGETSSSMETAPETQNPPAAGTSSIQNVTDEGIVSAAPPQAASPADPTYTTPADYVRRARQEFDVGRVEQALALLDAMRQRFPLGTDEAWWLYGQLLEANSPSRDIRLALEYYRRLVREYPQSNRVGAAQQRIAYLERYYFNIR